MAIKILDLKIERLCKTKYIYTDINGNKGISEHCFNKEGKYICRDTKHVIRVKNVQEKRECN